MMILRHFKLLFLMFWPLTWNVYAHAQTDTIPNSLYQEIATLIEMDSIVISASRSGFDIDDFVEMVLQDSSFYQAFRNLRTVGHVIEESTFFYDKDDNEIASLNQETQQIFRDPYRSNIALQSVITGKYLKKKKPRYYTSRLIQKAFYTQDSVKESSTQLGSTTYNSNIDYHIDQIKRLVFQPGRSIDNPLFGNKLSIFSDEMRPLYNFTVRSEMLNDSIEVYVFDIRLKPKFEQKERKSIIKSISTYFRKSDFQVVSRSYDMAYKMPLYFFDVQFEVHLQKLGAKYYPKHIHYDGSWKIITKKLERSKFDLYFKEFKIAP